VSYRLLGKAQFGLTAIYFHLPIKFAKRSSFGPLP
jgi:hypothetical protein